MIDNVGNQFLRNQELGLHRDRFGFDKQKWQDEAPTRQERLNYIKTRNKAEQEEMAFARKFNPLRLQKIRKELTQKTGRAPNRYEILQAMLKRGEIDFKDFKNAVLRPSIDALIFDSAGVPDTTDDSSSDEGMPSAGEWASGRR